MPFIDDFPLEVAHHLRTLGQRLRTARIRRGWTLAELAERAGINRKTLAALELGRQPGVTFSTFITVLWLLGLDRTLDGVANPDADTHGKTLEASRRPKRVRKSRQPGNEYDF